VLIGPVILSHYDLWPAAITTASLAAVASGRLRIAAVVLALAIVAKIYPVVLLPLLLDLAWRRSGRREAVICAALVTVVSLLVVAPFLAVAPGGILQPVVDQVLRPLQIESLGAAILFVLHATAGTEVTIVSSFGSQNLDGQLPQVLAAVQSL